MTSRGIAPYAVSKNATAAQVAEAQTIAPVVCVQNHYNLVHRKEDKLIDALVAQGIAYVPFFPLRGFSPIRSDALSAVAADIGGSPLQVAFARAHADMESRKTTSKFLLIP